MRGGGGFVTQVEQAAEAKAGLPAPEETSATLLNIAGAWYARPAGFQGVMLPVAEGGVAMEKLAEAGSYTASGMIVREGGNPTAFRVRRVER